MMTIESLTKLAAAAVRKINKENDIKLKKISAQLNDTGSHAAVIYCDVCFPEYRVLLFINGEHQVNADYHATYMQDALDTTHAFITQGIVTTTPQQNADDRLLQSLGTTEQIKKATTLHTQSRNKREGKYAPSVFVYDRKCKMRMNRTMRKAVALARHDISAAALAWRNAGFRC